MPLLQIDQPSSDRDANLRVMDILVEAAAMAGERILPYFNRGMKTSAIIHTKAGGSPVTDADLLADGFLRDRLMRAFPQAAWLSEESVDDPARLSRSDVLIVDPIDGTRGFIQGDPRWTVCIALVRNGRPVAGVVHAPAIAQTYCAGEGSGAFCNGGQLAVPQRAAPAQAKVAGPHGFLESLARQGLDIAPQGKIPSLAFRMVQVASGTLDIGLATNKAQDWDIAAADLIVCEAGGRFVTLDGKQPQYNRPDPVHPVLIATTPPLLEMTMAAVRVAANLARML